MICTCVAIVNGVPEGKICIINKLDSTLCSGWG